MNSFKMLIDGRWIDAKERIEVVNPFDESIIGTVPIASEEGIDRAIITSADAFNKFQYKSAHERLYTRKRKAIFRIFF